MSRKDKRALSLEQSVERAEFSTKALRPGLLLQAKCWFPFTRMSQDEAFLALLEIAVVIDREAHPDEAAELSALVDRSRSLSRLRANDRKGYLEVQRRVSQRKALPSSDRAFWDYVMEACMALSGKRRFSAFAHIVDLIFADRKLVQREADYIQTTARLLRIKRSESEAIMDVIRVKNEVRSQQDKDAPLPARREPLDLKDGEGLLDPALRQLDLLTPEAAHYALLLCAVWADKVKVPPEENELRALWRAPSLAACSERMRAAIAEYVRDMARRLGYQGLFDKAIEYLDSALARPVYAQAVDLVLVDHYVAPQEAKFLKELRTKLGVEAKFAEETVRVLRDKNEF